MPFPQRFSCLAKQVLGTIHSNESNPLIHAVTSDSRQVKQGSLFVAITGNHTNGLSFIETAIQLGASGIVCPEHTTIQWKDHPSIMTVQSTRRALALLSSSLYGPLNPSLTNNLIGITGTNGKTTTTYILEAILHAFDASPGVIGTINYRVGSTHFPSSLTTPPPEELWRILNEMQERSASHLLMEVSSHSLHQQRVDGLTFRATGFTNLSQDHLDYHLTLEEYLNQKSRLFSELTDPNGRSILNADDPSYPTLSQRCIASTWSYSLSKSNVDIYPTTKHLSPKGTDVEISTPYGKLSIRSKLVGDFNLSNIMLAIGIAQTIGVSNKSIEKGIASLSSVPGRLETLSSPQEFQVFVDFAHTPDALANVLQSIRSISKGKLILVFGCGGDRDRGKRPQMGKIASMIADISIVTSDNPRTEKPESIVNQIAEGMNAPELITMPSRQNGFWRCTNRLDAIQMAIQIAQKDDIVLIAGKGHEAFQILKNEKRPFNDLEVAKQAIFLKFQGSQNK